MGTASPDLSRVTSPGTCALGTVLQSPAWFCMNLSLCVICGAEKMGQPFSYDPASSSDGLASSLLLFTLFLVKQWGMGREDAVTSAGAGVKQGADHHQDPFPSYSLPSS